MANCAPIPGRRLLQRRLLLAKLRFHNEGFGFPGSANTNNRDYQEGTIGFIPTLWSSPNYGKLQVITQFSYVVRTPWFVAPGTPKNAHAFLTYLNLRYIIP